MTFEITGVIHHNRTTMLAPRPLSDFDLAHIAESAQTQEACGYDRVLIANSAVAPEPHVIATHVAAHTTTLKFMIAHRPGFMAPTLAARMLATIDRVSGGRAGVHIIAGPSEKELAADGDFLGKAERYSRSLEYVGIMRRLWTSTEAVDHVGKYYRFNQALLEVKPVQANLPVFWGGTTDAAVETGARCADIFALTGAPLAATAAIVDRVKEAARRHERTLRFMSTFLVVLGDTEELAWKNANAIVTEYLDLRAKGEHDWTRTKGVSNFGTRPPSAAFSPEGRPLNPREDKCFWTGMTQATQGKQGNQATLVGTPGQVTDALMDYWDLGVTGFLLRGYRPLEDARIHAREFFPMLRRAAAERETAVRGQRANCGGTPDFVR